MERRIWTLVGLSFLVCQKHERVFLYCLFYLLSCCSGMVRIFAFTSCEKCKKESQKQQRGRESVCVWGARLRLAKPKTTQWKAIGKSLLQLKYEQWKDFFLSGVCERLKSCSQFGAKNGKFFLSGTRVGTVVLCWTSAWQVNAVISQPHIGIPPIPPPGIPVQVQIIFSWPCPSQQSRV